MALGSQENQGFREATVEMKVSPLRALTHRHIYTELQSSLSRNESKPVEGIDTLLRRLLSCL